MAAIVATTDRLILRNWDHADRAPFLRHLNTPAVMRWLGGVQDEATAQAAFDRIDGFQYDFGHTLWILERRSDAEILGFCGLKRVNADGTDLIGQHEIGWRLREDAWGRGYAREAATASLDLAFTRFAAPHVVAFTVAGNVGSWRLMERLGMTRRADLDYDDPRYAGELNPTIVYLITAEEWLSSRSAR
ncbi:MAG: GNAT family N-acetyltransferase [Sphingomicrobium sp.]